MWRIKGIVISRDGINPKLNVPDPWYSKLKTLRKAVLIADFFLTIIGIIAAILSFPFGFPLIGGAFAILLMVEIGRHVTVKADVSTVSTATGQATGSVEEADVNDQE